MGRCSITRISLSPSLEADLAVVDCRLEQEVACGLLLEELRSRQTPVIVLVEMGQQSDIRQRDGLMVLRVSKPIKNSDLIGALQSGLSKEALAELGLAEMEPDELQEAEARERAEAKRVAEQLAKEEMAKAEAASVWGTPKKGKTLATEHPAKILLVEDIPLNQQIATMMLNDLGYEVDVAENGQEGVEKVNACKEGYDLIFMDLQMPVMGGVDATREIRGNFQLPKQPVIIAMTGNTLPGVRESCREAGMDDYLSKPVSLEDLTHAIKTTYAQPMAA